MTEVFSSAMDIYLVTKSLDRFLEVMFLGGFFFEVGLSVGPRIGWN